MSLHAPKGVVVIISLVLFLIAWIGPFTPIPIIREHPSFLITLAYTVLVLGCLHVGDLLPDEQ
jgi:hypothetical protein